MELKHNKITEVSNKVNLLIVPYGIETLKFVTWHSFQELLIVPYGIETE